MADFRLGRLKFNWRGNWTAASTYVIDDIIKFGANTYVCTTNHTSSPLETDWSTIILASSKSKTAAFITTATVVLLRIITTRRSTQKCGDDGRFHPKGERHGCVVVYSTVFFLFFSLHNNTVSKRKLYCL